MKLILRSIAIIALLLCFNAQSFAQTGKKGTARPKAAAKPTSKKMTVVEREDKIQSLFNDREWAKVIDLANQQLKEMPQDTNTVIKKAVAYGMLRNKEMVVSTIQGFFTDPDTAATFIATLPNNFSDEVTKADAGWYTDRATKLSPASPLPLLMKAAYLVDDSMYIEAKATAMAAWGKIKDDESRRRYGATIAGIMMHAGDKENAYAIGRPLIAQWGNERRVAEPYYYMLMEDKNYTEALPVIEKLIAAGGTKKNEFRKERVYLYKKMNRADEACTEAVSLSGEDKDYELLVRRMDCPAAYVNVSPSAVKQYTYNVDFHGSAYDFIVSPKNINMQQGADFDWRMTSSDEMKGRILISKAALDTAHAQMNMFSNGDKELGTQTSVWMSNAAFNDIKKNGKTRIDASGNGLKAFAIVDDEESRSRIVSNAAGHEKIVKTIHVQSEDGTEDIWVNDDAANPLIVEMNLGWTITLHDVQ